MRAHPETVQASFVHSRSESDCFRRSPACFESATTQFIGGPLKSAVFHIRSSNVSAGYSPPRSTRSTRTALRYLSPVVAWSIRPKSASIQPPPVPWPLAIAYLRQAMQFGILLLLGQFFLFRPYLVRHQQQTPSSRASCTPFRTSSGTGALNPVAQLSSSVSEAPVMMLTASQSSQVAHNPSSSLPSHTHCTCTTLNWS